MRDKREHLELIHDILHAIDEYGAKLVTSYGTLNLSKLQLYTYLNYNTIKEKVLKLEKNQLLTLKPLAVTPKGFLFMHEYEIMLKSKKRLEENIISGKDLEKIQARGPVTVEHKIKDYQQVTYAMTAIIKELENK